MMVVSQETFSLERSCFSRPYHMDPCWIHMDRFCMFFCQSQFADFVKVHLLSWFESLIPEGTQGLQTWLNCATKRAWWMACPIPPILSNSCIPFHNCFSDVCSNLFRMHLGVSWRMFPWGWSILSSFPLAHLSRLFRRTDRSDRLFPILKCRHEKWTETDHWIYAWHQSHGDLAFCISMIIYA